MVCGIFFSPSMFLRVLGNAFGLVPDFTILFFNKFDFFSIVFLNVQQRALRVKARNKYKCTL